MTDKKTEALKLALADSALDRMAENARELGLDYEPAPVVEPVAWMFQHEETGRTLCVDAQQVEWGFEKGNPRLKKIAPLYTSPQPAQQPRYDLLHEYAITNRLDYNGLCRVVRAATEQPAQQQEPVAWMCSDESLANKGYSRFTRTCEGAWNIPVYTSPPASKPLTDEQAEAAFKAWHYKHGNNTQGIKWVDDLLRSCWKAAIEAAHKIGVNK